MSVLCWVIGHWYVKRSNDAGQRWTECRWCFDLASRYDPPPSRPLPDEEPS